MHMHMHVNLSAILTVSAHATLAVPPRLASPTPARLLACPSHQMATIERDLVLELVRATQKSSSVPYRRGTLGLMGDGGMGKTTLGRALTGQPFVLEMRSTVGAQSQTIELHTEQVAIGGGEGHCVMGEYKPEAAEHERAIAAAAAAAKFKGGSASADDAVSRLDRVREAEAKEAEEEAMRMEEEKRARRRMHVAESSALAVGAIEAVGARESKVTTVHAAVPTPPPPAAASVAKVKREEAPKEEAVEVSGSERQALEKRLVELVGREGAQLLLKVLFMQDYGGQEVFDLIRLLLASATSNSVDLLVVSCKAIDQVAAVNPPPSH